MLILVVSVQGSVRSFVSFTPVGNVEKLQVRSAQVVAAWAVLALSILVPIYIKGANLYECGKPFLYVTSAYLYNDPLMEWAAATAACCSGGLLGFVVTEVLSECHKIEPPKSDEQWARLSVLQGEVFEEEVAISTETQSLPIYISQLVSFFTEEGAQSEDSTAGLERHNYTTSSKVWLASWWTVVLCALSVPSVIYCIGTSLPGGANRLGLSTFVLESFQFGSGAFLSVVNSFVIPGLAKTFIMKANAGVPDRNAAVKLSMATRTFITLIVPFVCVQIMNQMCFASWVLLWDGCASSESFSIKVLGHQVITHHQMLTVVSGLWPFVRTSDD